MSERKEALMRILVGIVSGIMLGVWKIFVEIISIFHWLYVIFTGNRIKSIADMANIWATQVYKFIRYMSFATNQRPFPFSELGNPLQPVEMKNKK